MPEGAVVPAITAEQQEAIGGTVRGLAFPDIDVSSVDIEEREDPGGVTCSSR